MNQMYQNETSKWIKMDQNHSKWFEIIKNRENAVTEMMQMDQNQTLKWMKMDKNHSK